MTPKEETILWQRIIHIENVLDIKPGLKGSTNNIAKIGKALDNISSVLNGRLSEDILKGIDERLDNRITKKDLQEDRENFKQGLYRYLDETLEGRTIKKVKLPPKPSFWDKFRKKKKT